MKRSVYKKKKKTKHSLSHTDLASSVNWTSSIIWKNPIEWPANIYSSCNEFKLVLHPFDAQTNRIILFYSQWHAIVMIVIIVAEIVYIYHKSNPFTFHQNSTFQLFSILLFINSAPTLSIRERFLFFLIKNRQKYSIKFECMRFSHLKSISRWNLDRDFFFGFVFESIYCNSIIRTISSTAGLQPSILFLACCYSAQ